ncbi:MAG: fibronectin type III domain-containing protein [Ignavibacteria bacterium]|nr:fibronectin type III domain-containing protein [Ignavibacteria bacterium]
MASASSDDGTPGGVTLDGTALTILLCTKVIPATNIGWGVCTGDEATKGTFRYEPSGPTLKFNAEASGLGGFVYDHPEVADLALTGVTQTTLRWTWTTPDRVYFVKNIVTVKETASEVIILNEEKAPGSNKVVNVMIFGLTAGTSYTITVQSVYDDPAGAGDGSYSLIYYRDSDPANVLPSDKGFKMLDQATSVNGVITFSGYQTIGQNIPNPPPADVNVRGKIWIVPTTQLNEDGTLKWTGYGAGNTMTDYLFESDLIEGGASPSEWMGGITYTYVP